MHVIVLVPSSRQFQAATTGSELDDIEGDVKSGIDMATLARLERDARAKREWQDMVKQHSELKRQWEHKDIQVVEEEQRKEKRRQRLAEEKRAREEERDARSLRGWQHTYKQESELRRERGLAEEKREREEEREREGERERERKRERKRKRERLRQDDTALLLEQTRERRGASSAASNAAQKSNWLEELDKYVNRRIAESHREKSAESGMIICNCNIITCNVYTIRVSIFNCICNCLDTVDDDAVDVDFRRPVPGRRRVSGSRGMIVTVVTSFG